MGPNIYFGVRDAPQGPEAFGVSGDDRFRHLYVIGASGTGKSTLLHNVLAQEMRAGEGCGLIDPHGDLAAAALALIPRSRTAQTVRIDLADRDHPVAFNPLFHVPEEQRALVAANLVAAFKHIWRESWGPRLEYILTNSLAALLDAPDRARPTLLALPRLLTDDAYRTWVLRHVRDPRVRAFWRDEFGAYSDRFAAEAIAPVQNKIGAFLASPAVRNIVGQWRSRVDLAEVIDRNGILIVNLAKGSIGAEPANLMGALVVAMIQAAAMARSDHPESERSGFHLIIDEFAYVTSTAFVDILAEARKYRLAVTLAHQHLGQLSEGVRAAVLANAGTIIAFRTGAEDAEIMSTVIGDIAPVHLIDLARGQAWVRISPPTTVPTSHYVRTFPALPGDAGRAQKIVRHSRSQHARPGRLVAKRINLWLDRQPRA